MDSEWDDEAMIAGDGICNQPSRRYFAPQGFPAALACLLAAVVFLPACSRLALPAIDPTGSRIFLPNNYTNLTVPRLHDGPGCLPTPAFTTPAPPAACVDGSGRPICNLFDHKKHKDFFRKNRSPGAKGELQLTPALIVAPVGGEVTLLAGICGEDGYLVTRQPLEWMLSPDSVGTFIDVGDDKPGALTRILRHSDPKIEKLDVDFARGRTSSKEEIITKGSPECTDDITVEKGQTWLSISSPSSGVSRITALAPDSDIWDRRHQTATIYWVDAQWEFPPIPAPARAGQTVELVTRVTKADNLVPAKDWLVKYTITNPDIAVFDTNPPSAGNELVVPVNADGMAIARLRAGASGRGTTQVLIDVIRPAEPEDRLPQLRLGGGQTMVTFSSPLLALEALGPELASPGQRLTYNASLGNAGDLDIENASLTMLIPEGWRLAGSPNPQPQRQATNFLTWDQGILPAGRQLDVQVDLIAGRSNSYDVVFEARGEPSLSQTKRLPINVVQSSVEAEFTPRGGVAQAEIGQTLQYTLNVRNNGPGAVTDVILLIESAPGLLHADSGTNSVEQRLPVLSPGQSYSDTINFLVQQSGQLDATLKVIAGEQVLAQRSASIQGLAQRQRRPDISVEIKFPETAVVGSRATAYITLGNSGETRLSDIQVEVVADASLVPALVDVANMSRFRRLDAVRSVWNAADLLPRVDANSGMPTQQLKLEFNCVSATNSGNISVRAVAAENVQATASATFSVTAPTPTAPPPTGGAGQGNEPRTGSWAIALRESGDPVVAGQQMSYYLSIVNQQNQADRDVQIQLSVPEGLEGSIEVSTNIGTRIPTQYSPTSSRVLELPVIRSVRQGERLDYIIRLTPRVAQEMIVAAGVSSAGIPTPVTVQETTSVTTPIR